MKITVTILPDDFSRELWQANRRQVVKSIYKGWKIDGIKGFIGAKWFWTATTNVAVNYNYKYV